MNKIITVTLILIITLMIISLVNAKNEYTIRPDISLYQLQKFELELFQLARQDRNDKIKWDNCLYKIAKERSKDMYDRNYFSHEDPITQRNETWDKIRKNCGYNYAGENLTYGFNSYDQANQALMDSPTHRDNIMNKRFNSMAVGCYENICTQLFINKKDGIK